MAELGEHLDRDRDRNLDLDLDSRCPSTGDPQLDQKVHQWLSWDKVSGCRGSRHQTSRHSPTLFYKHTALLTETAPTGTSCDF